MKVRDVYVIFSSACIAHTPCATASGLPFLFFFTVPVRYPLRRASVKGDECLSAMSVHEIYIVYNIYVLVRQDELRKAEGVTGDPSTELFPY